MKCAVTQTSKAGLNLPTLHFFVHVPCPGTQCHTSATSLRKQNSKLRESDPRHKTVHMKCAVTQTSKAGLNLPTLHFFVHVPCPGTQCHTSATSLRKQNSKLRESDPRHKTVHMKCAVTQTSKAGLNLPTLHFFVHVPCPGTQCHTSATSLRKQNSKLRESDPRHGAAHKDVRCRQSAKDGAFGGHPTPQRQELERLVCSAS